MSNKQQTAVEWFFEQLTEVDCNCINKTFLQNNNTLAGYRLRELFEQAKEKEKERIKNDYRIGYNNGILQSLLTPIEYYNETYGGNK